MLAWAMPWHSHKHEVKGTDKMPGDAKPAMENKGGHEDNNGDNKHLQVCMDMGCVQVSFLAVCHRPSWSGAAAWSAADVQLGHLGSADQLTMLSCPSWSGAAACSPADAQYVPGRSCTNQAILYGKLARRTLCCV